MNGPDSAGEGRVPCRRCGLTRGTAVHGNPFGAGHTYEPDASPAPAVPDDAGLREALSVLGWSEAQIDYGASLLSGPLAALLAERDEAVRQVEQLGEAITDLCWKATPYGGGEDVGAYLLPAGTVHRLIGAAQGAGIPAAFRVPGDPT